MSKGQRFEQYRVLFGRADDQRVDVMLDALEQLAQSSMKLRAGNAGYISTDIQQTAIAAALASRSLPQVHNENFANKEVGGDKDVHSEVKRFTAQLISRLCGPDGAARSDNSPAVVAAAKKLQGARPGSVEQLICLVMDNIATWTVNTTSRQSFVNNNSSLNTLTQVDYKSAADLYAYLQDLSFGTTLGQGLGLAATFTATPSTAYTTGGTTTDKKSAIDSLIGGTSVLKSEWSAEVNKLQDSDVGNGYTATGNVLFITSGTQASVAEITAYVIAFHRKLDTPRLFGLNMAKYVSRQLQAAKASAPGVVSAILQSALPSAQMGKYTMKNGKLVDASGADSDWDSLPNEECVGAAVDSTKASCRDYLLDCLKGQSVDKCKVYLQNQNFWKDSKDEVEKMNPRIAESTLRAFEWQFEDVYDVVANRKLKKASSTTKWLEMLKSRVDGTSPTPAGKLSQSDYNAIESNTKLIGYLNLVVEKVNASPAILNPGVDRSQDTVGYNEGQFKGSYFAKLGVKPHVPVSRIVPAERMANVIRLGSSPVFGFGMVGGGAVEDLESRLRDDTRLYSAQVQREYMALREQLNRQGKSLSQADDDQIQKLLGELKQREQKLVEVKLIMASYLRLLQVHGANDPSGTLSVDNMKQFAEKHEEILRKTNKTAGKASAVLLAVVDALRSGGLIMRVTK